MIPLELTQNELATKYAIDDEFMPSDELINGANDTVLPPSVKAIIITRNEAPRPHLQLRLLDNKVRRSQTKVDAI